MRFSANTALLSVIITGIILGNAAFYISRYPAVFSGGLSDEARLMLGCIDQSAFALMDSFREAAHLKHEFEVPAAVKLNWLQTINANAGVQLGSLGDCYDRLLALEERHDTSLMERHIETIIDLYEPIFVGEAVLLSKAIREMAGIVGQTEPLPSSRFPSLYSENFIEKASDAASALSTEISKKVVVR